MRSMYIVHSICAGMLVLAYCTCVSNAARIVPQLVNCGTIKKNAWQRRYQDKVIQCLKRESTPCEPPSDVIPVEVPGAPDQVNFTEVQHCNYSDIQVNWTLPLDSSFRHVEGFKLHYHSYSNRNGCIYLKLVNNITVDPTGIEFYTKLRMNTSGSIDLYSLPLPPGHFPSLGKKYEVERRDSFVCTGHPNPTPWLQDPIAVTETAPCNLSIQFSIQKLEVFFSYLIYVEHNSTIQYPAYFWNATELFGETILLPVDEFGIYRFWVVPSTTFHPPTPDNCRCGAASAVVKIESCSIVMELEHVTPPKEYVVLFYSSIVLGCLLVVLAAAVAVLIWRCRLRNTPQRRYREPDMGNIQEGITYEEAITALNRTPVDNSRE